MISRSARKLALTALFVSLLSAPLSAQEPLSERETAERLALIQEMLSDGKQDASLWWNGWLWGYGLATAVQGAVFLASDHLQTRQDMAVGAVTTLLGMAGQLIAPMTPASAPGKLAASPEGTPEERKAKLAEAERLLAACAKREKDGRSWKNHALTGAVNLGAGLVVWLGFKRSVWEGLANFAVNTVVTEVQIWTQPIRAVRDYEDYVRGTRMGSRSVKSRMVFTVYGVPGGLGVRMAF